MAKINFIIKAKQEGQPATVYLRYSDIRGIDIVTSTPEKIFPEYWSNKNQSFKQRISFTDIFTEQQKTDIETRLIEIKAFVNKEYFLLKGKPANIEWLKSTLNKYYDKGSPSSENLNQYIKRFIEEATSGTRLCFSGHTKKAYSEGTLRSYRDFKRSFNLYQGIYEVEEGKRKRKVKEEPKRPYRPMNFNDINIDFYNEFMQFFFDRKCGANYVGKHIKTIKTIIRQAREEGLHDNREVERKAFKAISEPSESIYLNEIELNNLYKLNLSETKHIEIARDVFLCGCYTAQRYSDYSRINKDMIKTYSGKKVIELNQQKTGEKCIIPIMPELEEILKKYDYTLPKTYEQKLNEYIKVAGKLAGITEEIHFEHNKGGMTVKVKMQKFELIKTHSARRSGCTLMYLAGIPTIDIMKISGHKTEREFLKYIKVSKQETAINLASHPYYNQNRLNVV